MHLKNSKITTVLLAFAVIASMAFVFTGAAQAAWEWSALGLSSPGSAVWSLAYDGTNLYAGCDNGTVYQNNLSGGAWIQTGSNTPGTRVWSLAYDGTNLYAGCGDGTVYQNALSGGAWTQTGSDTPGSRVGSLAYDGTNLYAGCLNGTVYQNALAGGAWTQTGSNTPGADVRSLAYDGTRLFAGCEGGSVYQNDLSGGAWTLTGSNTPGSTVYSLVYDGTRLFAGCLNGTVYQNALAGGAWTQTGSNTPGSPVLALALDGANIYAGCLNGIVYQNALAGGAWTQTGSNTPGANVRSLTYIDSNLYAGCQDGNVYTIQTPFAEGSTWYLAEGTTSWGFDAYITITNPNSTPLTAHVTYMLTGGATLELDVPLPGSSQTTVNPRETVGNQDFSTEVVSSDLTKPIAVDRTMSWTGGAGSGTGQEAHSSVGVTSPSNIWYMPEGSTEWGFETWLCIQNPNVTKATCQVTYMIEGGSPVTKTKEVPGNARETYNMYEDIGNKDASIRVTSDKPVIPERSMYRNARRAGHESIGTTASAPSYYLAEGTTDYGFTTYLCVQNPNNTDVGVNITYMTEGGPVAHPANPVPMTANSRKTIRVNDVLPNTDFSTQVSCSEPIIAERAMYWDNGTGEACHDSIGMASPHKTFYLPDGQSSDGRETYTCVQNPNVTAVQVTITYLKAGGGTPVSRTESIPANTRKTYSMLEHSGIQGRASVVVTSKTAGKNIMVERAMYWNSRGAGTDTIGGYSD